MPTVDAVFMAKATGLAAGCTGPRGDPGRPRGGPHGLRSRLPLVPRRRACAKANDQFISGDLCLDAHRIARTKSQIDIIPGNRGVPPVCSRRPRDYPRVRMPLDNLAPGLQRGFVKRIRELAEAAAGCRDQASFLQHASGDKATPPGGASDLFPEAEQRSRRNDDSLQRRRSAPQIVHLTQLIKPFLRLGLRPKRRR